MMSYSTLMPVASTTLRTSLAGEPGWPRSPRSRRPQRAPGRAAPPVARAGQGRGGRRGRRRLERMDSRRASHPPLLGQAQAQAPAPTAHVTTCGRWRPQLAPAPLRPARPPTCAPPVAAVGAGPAAAARAAAAAAAGLGGRHAGAQSGLIFEHEGEEALGHSHLGQAGADLRGGKSGGRSAWAERGRATCGCNVWACTYWRRRVRGCSCDLSPAEGKERGEEEGAAPGSWATQRSAARSATGTEAGREPGTDTGPYSNNGPGPAGAQQSALLAHPRPSPRYTCSREGAGPRPGIARDEAKSKGSKGKDFAHPRVLEIHGGQLGAAAAGRGAHQRTGHVVVDKHAPWRRVVPAGAALGCATQQVGGRA